MDEFSIIGTTDVEYNGDPKDVAIDDNEIQYLRKVYNDHFKKAVNQRRCLGITLACVHYVTMNQILHRRSPVITLRCSR